MFDWLNTGALSTLLLVLGGMNISQAQQLTLRQGNETVESVRFTNDGKRFVSASIDGTVVMWNSRSGKIVWKVELDRPATTKESHPITQVLGMDLAPDDTTIAVSYSRSVVAADRLQGKDEYLIALLDPSTGRKIKELTGHTDLIGCVAFSPNGLFLLTESRDQTARLWDVKSGAQLLVTKLKEKGAAVAFSPTGKLFAVATQPIYGLPPKPIVGLYDSNTGDLLREFPRRTNVVTSIAFSSDDHVIGIAGGDASGALIDVWDSTKPEPTKTLTAKGRGVNAIAFSKDGHLLASGGFSNGYGFVEVNDLVSNKLIRSFRVNSDVTSIDFSKDGGRLLVGTNKGKIVDFALRLR